MILEGLLEQKIVEQLSSIDSLSGTQFIASRSVDKTEDGDSVVAVAAGFRQHDSFSLTPVTLPVTFTIVTKVEEDAEQQKHNTIVEAIADKLSYWHKFGTAMQDALTTEKCVANELKMDGGSESTFDDTQRIWTDIINISIRGAEKFIPPPDPYVGWTWYKYAGSDKLHPIEITGEAVELGLIISNPQSITDLSVGEKVTSLIGAFSGFFALSNVVIPDTITNVGAGTFSECSSLLSVEIPDSALSIGDRAFYKCASLQTIVVGSGVSAIHNHAFLNVNDDIQSVQFRGKTLEQLSIMSGYSWGLPNTNVISAEFVPALSNSFAVYSDGRTRYWHVDGNSFKYSDIDKNGLVSLRIQDDNIASIGNLALQGAISLSSVQLPSTLLYIQPQAFEDCHALLSVDIPEGTQRVFNAAFQVCLGLKTVIIPSTVTFIGEDAFRYCRNVDDVYCYADPQNLEWNEDGKDDFKEDGSTVCHVKPQWLEAYQQKFGNTVNVTFAGDLDMDGKVLYRTTAGGEWLEDTAVINNGTFNGFANKENAVEVIIPSKDASGNDVTSIGSSAFENCIGLTSVTIPDSVTSIGNYAFNYCVNLTRVTIPNSVTSIGDGAFATCFGLTSVTIPDSVTSIGDSVFSACSGLSSVTIGNGVKSIGNAEFAWCSSLTSVTIPDSVSSIGDSVFYNCASLQNIVVGSGVSVLNNYAFLEVNDEIQSVQFREKTIEQVRALSGYAWGLLDAAVISAGLPSPPLSDCYAVFEDGTARQWHMPRNIFTWTDVDVNGLVHLQIQEGVTSIALGALRNANKLRSLILPSTLISISDQAFSYCSSLTAIVLPERIQTIDDNAFIYCSSAKTVTIPSTVTSIGEDAFWNCTAVNDVYCWPNPRNLTWIESDKDDFKEDGSTLCHVKAEYLSAYQTKFGDEVNATFVGDLQI